MWNDGSGGTISCGPPGTGDYRVVMRGVGGFIFLSATTNNVGVQVLPGANAWSSNSDRRYKDHVRAVDGREVLERLASLPIATWNWQSQPAAIRHMGPMAQDFHAAFGLGESETMISTVDSDGVALAAIQGLNAKVNAKDAEIAALRERLAKVEANHIRDIADLRVAVELIPALG